MKARIDEVSGRKREGVISITVSYFEEADPDYIFFAYNFEFNKNASAQEIQDHIIYKGQEVRESMQNADTVKQIVQEGTTIDIPAKSTDESTVKVR